MIKNYLKIAFRSLWRSKAHSLINIVGLSLGICVCVLIVLFVNDEWTFDKFNSKADRIFRVYARENWGENQEFFSTTTPFPMGPTLKENIAEVEKYVRITKAGTLVKIADNQFTERLTIADRDIFEVFDFDLIKGDRSSVFEKQSNIVISKDAAKKYFGDEDPISKTLSVQIGENFEEFTVTGVADVPINSSVSFFLLVSDLNLPKLFNERVLTSGWFNINPETYVMLHEGVAVNTVTHKFPSIFKTVLGEEDFRNSNYTAGLQPLTTIHLDASFPAGIAPVSNPRYANILAAIAILILAVGCINFVTLSIGRSLKRAKEVGIRKVVGAVRKQLITQFIGEAVIVTMISMLIGVALAAGALPLFNDLSGKSLVFPVDGFLFVVIVALLLIIGLVAGSYPAFVLSSFRPISILKGSLQTGSKQGLRKVLVGVQLVLSIFLISSTLLMRDQLDYLQNKNLGFNKEQLLVIQLNVPHGGRIVERVNKGFEQAEQFKSELNKFPDVAAVCAASHDFANGAWVNIGYTDDNDAYRTFYFNTIDDEYINVLGMKLIAGRNFSENIPADKRRSIIVNEAFVREYGWSDPIGKRIPGKKFPDHEVIGVVSDFNYSSLYTKVQPVVLVLDPAVIAPGIENIDMDNSPMPKLLVKLKPGNMLAAIDQIKTTWDRLTGGQEFTFSFVDQALADQYRADQNLGKIVKLAALLAIIIGSLGLYGLASLAMQNRVKEISIRKVLGATERSLLVLLSKDYVVLILVSLVLSVPITVYLMRGWLSTFEYRIDIGWQVFVVAGGISLMIALITISYQTIKTAMAQPADTLKYE